MSLTKIINWELLKAEGDLFGTIQSPFYEYYDAAGQFTWACDVDIGEDEVLRNVPVATNNHDILYAQEGMPVSLKKMGNNKYAIVGLSKKVHGTTHIIRVSFHDSMGTITDYSTRGYYIRPLTYEELDTYGDYGIIPYGVRGRFNADGDLVELVRTF